NAADHRLEQLDLGLEVKIWEALAHFCPSRDIFKSRAGKALLGKFLECSIHDLLRANLLFPAPFFRARQLPLIRRCLCHGSPPWLWGWPTAAPILANIMTVWSVLQVFA